MKQKLLRVEQCIVRFDFVIVMYKVCDDITNIFLRSIYGFHVTKLFFNKKNKMGCEQAPHSLLLSH